MWENKVINSGIFSDNIQLLIIEAEIWMSAN